MPSSSSSASKTTTRGSSSTKKDGSDDDEGRRLTVHWFRNTDLRLHDNPTLCCSVELSLLGGKRGGGKTQTTHGGMLPVFVFDTLLPRGESLNNNPQLTKIRPYSD